MSPFFGIFLQVYKATLMYLYVPYYNYDTPKKFESEDLFKWQSHNLTSSQLDQISWDTIHSEETQQSVRIFILWCIWFSTTFFINIMTINFLVSIIITSFENAEDNQKIIYYKQKAELNLECF